MKGGGRLRGSRRRYTPAWFAIKAEPLHNSKVARSTGVWMAKHFLPDNAGGSLSAALLITSWGCIYVRVFCVPKARYSWRCVGCRVRMGEFPIYLLHLRASRDSFILRIMTVAYGLSQSLALLWAERLILQRLCSRLVGHTFFGTA